MTSNIKKNYVLIIISIFLSVTCLISKATFEKCVWLTTVHNSDWPKSKDAEEQKVELRNIIKDIHFKGISKVFFQVRPRGDALYNSEMFPWSVWLTGELAKNPGYDPLRLCIDECNRYGIKCEAWINPFLVLEKNMEYNKNDYISKLPDGNPIKKHPEWLVKYYEQKDDKGNNFEKYILNIGIPEVRDLIIKEVEYICKNYDVSGIHIDDYFYPYPCKGNIDNFDINTYNEYKSGQLKMNKEVMSIDDWRRDNVNKFIKSVHNSLKKLDKTFSVSPFGIWKNVKNSRGSGKDTNGLESYNSISCDSKKWVEEGWIDYIVPQIYWECGHDRADFVTLSDWWNNLIKEANKKLKDKKVKLLLGLSVYKIDENTMGPNWESPDEIKKQINIAKKLSDVSGVSLFSYKHVERNLGFLNS